jgi:CubicO group peptidase (beta-lactamase class C family)
MKTTLQTLIIIVLFFAISCVGYAGELLITSPKDVGMSPEKLAKVKPAVQALVDTEKIAGASVIVARKGKVVLFETFGMMDIEAKKSMEKDTIFRFYSMTKPITSVAVMMLYEEGKLNLDDPVSKYVPEFKGLKVYDESGKHIEQEREMSIRDLLRHTSGLTYGFFGNTPVDKMYMAKSVFDWDSSLQDMINKLSEIPLLYQPGTKWHYSVSTDVLGYIVEKISGQSLDKFFNQRIFKPLKMKDTAFYVPANKVERFAACYGPKLTGGLRIVDDPAKSRYLKKRSLLSGGGGLVSTAQDYLRFCQMMLNKGELDGKRLLRPETVEMMTTNQLPDSVRRDEDGGFGLGFSVRLNDGEFPKGEYGWGGAASTHFWISPKHDLIVIALSQYQPYSARLENTVKPIVYDSILNLKSQSQKLPAHLEANMQLYSRSPARPASALACP